MSLAPILYNEDPEAAFLRPGKNSLFLWPKRITARVGPDSYTAISVAHNRCSGGQKSSFLLPQLLHTVANFFPTLALR